MKNTILIDVIYYFRKERWIEMLKRKVQQISNTLLVVIPQGICEVMKLRKGDEIGFVVHNGAVIIKKIRGEE